MQSHCSWGVESILLKVMKVSEDEVNKYNNKCIVTLSPPPPLHHLKSWNLEIAMLGPSPYLAIAINHVLSITMTSEHSLVALG